MIFTSTKNYLPSVSFQVRISWYNTSTQTFYKSKFTREGYFFQTLVDDETISMRWKSTCIC
jgi:hypothetical protein